MEMEDDFIPAEDYFTLDVGKGWQSFSSMLGSFDLGWKIRLRSKITGMEFEFNLEENLNDEQGNLVGWLYYPTDKTHPHVVTVWNR